MRELTLLGVGMSWVIGIGLVCLVLIGTTMAAVW